MLTNSKNAKLKLLLSRIMCFVLCLSLVLIGVLGALSCTLWKEGWLIKCADKSGYTASMRANAEAGLSIHSQNAGLPADFAHQFVTDEILRTDFLLNVDRLFRGSNGIEYMRMNDVAITAAKIMLRGNTDTAPTFIDSLPFHNLQSQCEQAYSNAVLVPFATVLSSVLQYRVFNVVLLISALVLIAAALALQYILSEDMRTFLQRITLGISSAALALLLLSTAVAICTPSAIAWMPATNNSLAAYTHWLWGFAPAICVSGLICLGGAIATIVISKRKYKEPQASTALDDTNII